LTDFERGEIVGAQLGGASVKKTATLLCALIATVSDVMSAWVKSHPTKKKSVLRIAK
jgi:hypothetical protein